MLRRAKLSNAAGPTDRKGGKQVSWNEAGEIEQVLMRREANRVERRCVVAQRGQKARAKGPSRSGRVQLSHVECPVCGTLWTKMVNDNICGDDICILPIAQRYL